MTDTKKKRPRRRFSEEFKREAVALYQSSGVSATQLCVELGVSQSLLYRWAREFRDPQPPADRPSYNELVKKKFFCPSGQHGKSSHTRKL